MSQHKQSRNRPGRHSNFWLGGPILKVCVSKQVLRRRETFLHFSQIMIGPHVDPVFAKTDSSKMFLWITDQTEVQSKFFCLLGTCLGTRIFKIGPASQKLHLVTFFCHIGYFYFQFSPFCKNREERTHTVIQHNFWLGGPILKNWVSKQVPRKRKTLLHFSSIEIGPQVHELFTKTFCLNQIFANTGSKQGPIKKWLKCKSVSCLFGTCLDTHYLMGLEPNWKKILHNSGKQIRIPEGM